MDRRKQITKQPSEEFSLELNYRERLPFGSTELVSLTASAVKWPRREPNNKTDATGEILADTDGELVLPYKIRGTLVIVGGTHNYEYQISVLAEFDNGSKLEDEVFVRVRED